MAIDRSKSLPLLLAEMRLKSAQASLAFWTEQEKQVRENARTAIVKEPHYELISKTKRRVKEARADIKLWDAKVKELSNEV